MVPEQLSPNASQLFSAAMDWMDSRWSESEGLLQLDPLLSYRGKVDCAVPHYVRESAFYALGLFLRGDLRRAIRALERVLECQLTERNTEASGSFLRHPEEVISDQKTAAEWADFNPNWREYIGLALALILSEFSDRLPPILLKRTTQALRTATAGSLWRRVPASYSHIALLKAFLLSFCGARFGLEAWVEGGEMQGREIFRLFKEGGDFAPFNSPSHYGIDLLALSLWRKYSSSRVMEAMAEEMEMALWKEIAQFYHAAMQNLAGPYDRAYGIDMRQYGSPLGLCIWASLGRDGAPFPDLNQAFHQAHEIAFAIPLVITGVSIPAKLEANFTKFQGERQVERSLSLQGDCASTWVAEELMLGGRTETLPSAHANSLPSSSCYPATIHWLSGDQVGWIGAQSPSPMAANAAEKSLSIQLRPAAGEDEIALKFLISSPSPPIFALDKWSFPSLTIEVSSNLTFSAPAGHGELFEIECRLPPPQQEAFVSFKFQK